MTADRELALRLDPEALMSAEDIAALCGYSKRYVLEDLAAASGFPGPLKLTGPGRRRGQPRWRRADIIEWLHAHTNGRSKRGGRPRK